MRQHIPGYLQHLRETGATADTLRTYRSRLTGFAAWLEGRECEWTRMAVLDYIRDCQDRGLKPSTIRPARTAILGLATWLRSHLRGKERRVIPDLSGVRAPSLTPPERYTPTDEDMGALWKAALALPGYTAAERFARGKAIVILLLASCTAIRRFELLALEAQDVQRHRDPWILVVRAGKGRKRREIPVSAVAQKWLEEWFELRDAWVRAEPARARNRFLLPVDSRRGCGDGTINMVIGRLNRAADLPQRVTLHCIRHWAATKMAGQEGVALKDIAAILGHADTRTTERYLHPVRERQILAVSAIQVPERPADDRTPEPRQEASSQSRARVPGRTSRTRKLRALGRLSRSGRGCE